MRKTVVYITLFTLSLFHSFTLHAEDNNPGLWVGAGVEKKLGKKWTVGVEGELRTMKGVEQMDRMSLGIAGDYKPWKFLKASLGYEYLHSREQGDYSSTGKYYNSSYWYPRHRVNLSLTGQVKLWKRLSVSLRERGMYTYRPEFTENRLCVSPLAENYGMRSTKTIQSQHKYMLRSRLQLEYNIKKCDLSPFASCEIYNNWELQKIRYTVGADWSISKHHSMKFFYLYQDNRDDSGSDDDDDAISHVIGASYTFSF